MKQAPRKEAQSFSLEAAWQSPKGGKLGILKNYLTKEQLDTRDIGKQSEPDITTQKVEEKHFDNLEDLFAARKQFFPGDRMIISDNGATDGKLYFQYLEESYSPDLEMQLTLSYKSGDLQFKYSHRSTGSKHVRKYVMFANIWERIKTVTETGKSKKEWGYVVFHLPDDEFEAIHRQRKDAKEARKAEAVPALAAEHALQLQADKKAVEKTTADRKAAAEKAVKEEENIEKAAVAVAQKEAGTSSFTWGSECYDDDCSGASLSDEQGAPPSKPLDHEDLMRKLDALNFKQHFPATVDLPSRVWADMDDAEDTFSFEQLPAPIGEFVKKADCSKAGGKGKGEGKEHGRASVPSHTSARQQDGHPPLVKHQ